MKMGKHAQSAQERVLGARLAGGAGGRLRR
jgi:hypothetical protein